MQSNKIRRILPRKVTIQNLTNYKVFLKKCPKVVKELKFMNHLGFYPDGPEKCKRMQLRLVKLFQTIKYVKALDIKRLDIWERTDPLPKMNYIFKLASRIECLSFCDLVSRESSLLFTILCLKHLKKLKHIDYFLNHSYEDDELESFTAQYIEKAHKMFVSGINQSKLKAVKILFCTSHASSFEPFLKLSSYPSSLQKWSIYFSGDMQKIEFNVPKQSLLHAQVANLRAIDLRFYGNIITANSALIKSFIDYKNLRSLSVRLRQNQTDSFLPCVGQLKELKMLEEFKFILDHWTQELESLFEAAKAFPLKYLGFGVQIKDESNIAPIGKFISHFKQLETLKLEINTHDALLKSEKTLRDLFSEISELKKVKYLKLWIINTVWKIDKKHFLSKIVQSLGFLLKESVSLTKFSKIKPNQSPNRL